MTARLDVARALAFFEAADDPVLLHRLIAEIAPRARSMVAGLLRGRAEDDLPPPSDIRAAREAASADEALATLRGCTDFPLLQTMARAIGRRIEELEIAASAEFPPGARVEVPERVAFPPPRRRVAGVVEESGTSLTVRLDDGETWQGPPTLARREGAR